MFVVYVDDGIVVDKDLNNIMKVIEELKAEGYDIEDKQSISDYLGVNFKYLEEDKI